MNKTLKQNIIIPTTPGPTAIFEHSDDEKLVKQLMAAYASNDLKKRQKLDNYRIK